MQINFKKSSPNAKIPQYALKGDAGMDLFSCEEVVIPSGEWRLVDTGIAIELPENTEAQVRSKSGLALRSGLQVLNSPGTIDMNYRGSIGVVLFNHSKEPYNVIIGQKIAQLVIAPYYTVQMSEVTELSNTERGIGGFGSTGINK